METAETAVYIIKRFILSDPAQAALFMEDLPAEQGAWALSSIDRRHAAACVEKMRPHYAAEMLRRLSPETAAGIIILLPHYHAADIVRMLPHDQCKQVCSLIPTDTRKDLLEIVSYPKDSAGRLMRKDFVSFRETMKLGEVVQKLRQLAEENVYTTYCYVVGDNNRLLGLLNTRDMLLSQPDMTAAQVMIKNLVSVSPFADRELLTAIFREKHFFAVPVVDELGRIIGVVNAGNLIESTEQEASEDIQILFGASPDESVHSPVWFKIRKRLPWLHINLATAFLAGAVVSLFEGLVAKISVIAVFLPIIIGQGGNAGIQTLSVVLRGLVMREISPKHAWKMLGAEIAACSVNGLIIGIVTAFIAWVWKGSFMLGVVVGLAMFLNMIVAGVAGAVLPMAMKKLGFDPAHSSGIFVTTLTDIVGLLALLGLAWLFQGSLIASLYS